MFARCCVAFALSVFVFIVIHIFVCDTFPSLRRFVSYVVSVLFVPVRAWGWGLPTFPPPPPILGVGSSRKQVLRTF